MKPLSVLPPMGLIILTILSGCTTTSVIDLSSPGSDYSLAKLNRKSGKATVWTRATSEAFAACTGQHFEARRFVVTPDFTTLVLSGDDEATFPTACLSSLTLPRRVRGAAWGFLAGTGVGMVLSIPVMLTAYFLLVWGDADADTKAAAAGQVTIIAGEVIGTVLGWMRGSPAHFYFTPGTPQAPEPGFRQSSVWGHGDPIPAEELREYIVPHTTAPLAIDGRLDEPAWQTAPFTEDFVLYADGQTPQQTTKARMLWDDTALYIAFTLEDRDAWATMTNHDDRLWEEEAAEVFIDPDGDGLDYVELQVNALGATLDLLMSKAYSEGGSGDFEWTLDGFTAGVVVDGSPEPGSEDRGWTVEMALPFAGLQAVAPSMNFPPRPGDTWRINLCRMEAAFGDRSTLEASAWNQTDSRGFHVPERFGRIVFAAE